MNKTVLLAAAAAFALTAGGASAAQTPALGAYGHSLPLIHVGKKAKVLYNQTSSENGEAIDSQNFTSGSFASADDMGADDFVVPKGQTWTITEVDAPGIYFADSGPSASEDVIFWSNDKKAKTPGKAEKGGTFDGLKGTDNSGSFSIKLPKKGMTLKAGTYWVSVIANCSFEGGCGEWGWDENGKIHGADAVWQNPGGYFGVCPSWGTIADCISGAPAGDFAFELLGSSKK
jgi:hypothetical protein